MAGFCVRTDEREMQNAKGLGKKCKFVKGPESGALGVLSFYRRVEREKRFIQRKTEKGNEPEKGI